MASSLNRLNVGAFGAHAIDNGSVECAFWALADGMTISDAAQTLGFSEYAIGAALEDAGLVVCDGVARSSGERLAPPAAATEIQLSLAAGTSVEAISRDLGFSVSLVTTLIDRYGCVSANVWGRRAKQEKRKKPKPSVSRSGPRTERAAKMYEMYSMGSTLGEIGTEFGITKERVRQSLAGFGYDAAPLVDRRRAAAKRYEEDIVAAHKETSDESELAARFKLPRSTIRTILRERPSAMKIRKRPSYAKLFSDEEIIDCLRSASKVLGGVLTTAGYTELAKQSSFPNGRPWPTHQTAFNRFGSWRAALAAAGLAANESSAIRGQLLFSKEQCADAIRHVAREVGGAPTVAQYETVAQSSGGALPSVATVRKRFGSWHDAMVAADL